LHAKACSKKLSRQIKFSSITSTDQIMKAIGIKGCSLDTWSKEK